MREFCIAGPVQPDIHYSIPPLDRINREEVMRLIDNRSYFVLHAPRQTGKTSALMALVDHLNSTGKYRALYVNVEGAQAARDDITQGIRTVVLSIAERAATWLNDPFLANAAPGLLDLGPGNALRSALSAWCAQSPLPICLMIDEIDALIGDTLISVLRQLRAGHADRPAHYPQSIILCGVRDVRDYRIHGAKEVITGGSAFNIKATSLRLADFSEYDVRVLYGQHTAETGQHFEEAVFPLVWELTRGQPWLVNALAQKACFTLERHRSHPITEDVIRRAKEALILERVTHLDQLTDKLREPRVRRVIEPLLASQDRLDRTLTDDDDVQYVLDLGLIRRGPAGFEIANALYREVIPRQLTYLTQIELESHWQTSWYVLPDGRLDMPALLQAFQQFFRENSEIWLERFEYQEAGPHLLMQAFLQRIVNGGGRIDREYALGRRRTDLLILWNTPAGPQRIVIEIKIQWRGLDQTLSEGLKQTAEYVDRTGAGEAHLIIFNRDPAAKWEDKIFRREQGGITIWGL